MTLLKVLALAILQGLTEFLPVSSSGHLRLLEKLLRFRGPEPVLEVWLHLGTLLSIIFVYAEDLRRLIVSCYRCLMGRSSRDDRQAARFAFFIVVALIPTAFVAYILKGAYEALSLSWVGVMFLVTAFILFLTKGTGGKMPPSRIGLFRSLIIGFTQGVAVLPGVSRSGSTIAVGLVFGIPRGLAARFSFFIAIPAIIGAVIIEGRTLPQGSALTLPVLIAGAALSAMVGYIALKALLHFLEKGKLWYFSLYLVVVAVITFVVAGR